MRAMMLPLAFLLLATIKPPTVAVTVRQAVPETRRVVVLTGKVRGTIDGKLVALTGANIELRDLSKAPYRQTIASVVSDTTGSYQFSNPDTSTGERPDVPAGQYVVFASYRSVAERPIAKIMLRTNQTSRKNIFLGIITRAGGAAGPIPRPEFYVTDRETEVGTQDISREFLNKRINDPCTASPTCMMHYGMVVPQGPILTNPSSNHESPDFASFLAMLQSQYPHAQSVLVFIHGYNNDFFDPYSLGATWLASYDPAMPVIVYSWPSNHSTVKYIDDETNNTWSADHFRDFLMQLLNDAKAPQTINIFAHSMGNRLAISALDYVADAQVQTRNHIGQVIFAAPDVDSGTFFEDVPKFAGLAKGITVYGSTHDNALQLSRGLHGHCRAGLVNCEFDIPNIPNVNGVDASIFRCDFLGHGYWAQSTTMSRDIVRVLAQGVNTPGNIRPNLVPLGGMQSIYYFNAMDADDQACAGKPKD